MKQENGHVCNNQLCDGVRYPQLGGKTFCEYCAYEFAALTAYEREA